MKPNYLGITLWLLVLISIVGMVNALIEQSIPAAIVFAAIYAVSNTQLYRHILKGFK